MIDLSRQNLYTKVSLQTLLNNFLMKKNQKS